MDGLLLMKSSELKSIPESKDHANKDHANRFEGIVFREKHTLLNWFAQQPCSQEVVLPWGVPKIQSRKA